MDMTLCNPDLQFFIRETVDQMQGRVSAVEMVLQCFSFLSYLALALISDTSNTLPAFPVVSRAFISPSSESTSAQSMGTLLRFLRLAVVALARPACAEVRRPDA